MAHFNRAPTRVLALVAVVAFSGLAFSGTASAATHHHHHRLRDSDRDGMPNRWERAHGLRAFHRDAKGNPDHDGLVNLAEFTRGTDPQVADSDSDGLSDGSEVHRFDTDPTNPDTDEDGVTDGGDDGNGDGLPDEGEDGDSQDGFIVGTILNLNPETGVLTFATVGGYPLAATVTAETKISFGGDCEGSGTTSDLVEGQDIIEMRFGDFEPNDEFPPLRSIVLACPCQGGGGSD